MMLRNIHMHFKVVSLYFSISYVIRHFNDFITALAKIYVPPRSLTKYLCDIFSLRVLGEYEVISYTNRAISSIWSA
jgi:hypothetical protein